MIVFTSLYVPAYGFDASTLLREYLAMSDEMADIPPPPSRGIRSSEESNDVTNYLITNNNGADKREGSNAAIGTSSIFKRSENRYFFPEI